MQLRGCASENERSEGDFPLQGQDSGYREHAIAKSKCSKQNMGGAEYSGRVASGKRQRFLFRDSPENGNTPAFFYKRQGFKKNKKWRLSRQERAAICSYSSLASSFFLSLFPDFFVAALALRAAAEDMDVRNTLILVSPRSSTT